jgi:XRE family transcriptional regulator, regulator of sulfur utilization
MNDKQLAKHIAKKLREYRKKKGYSQMDVADKAGMHFTYYSQIERALRPDISVRRLKDIADVLGVSLDHIVY